MAAHVDLWVKVSSMSNCEIRKSFCKINREAVGHGSSIGYISKVLSHRSVRLLAEDESIEPYLQQQLFEAIENDEKCSQKYSC